MSAKTDSPSCPAARKGITMGLLERRRRTITSQTVTREISLWAETKPSGLLAIVEEFGQGVGLEVKSRQPNAIEIGRRSFVKRLASPESDHPIHIWARTIPRENDLLIVLDADNACTPYHFKDDEDLRKYLEASLDGLEKAIVGTVHAHGRAARVSKPSAPQLPGENVAPAAGPTVRASAEAQPAAEAEVMPLVRVKSGGSSSTITSGPRWPQVDSMEHTRWHPPGSSASIAGVSVPDGMVYIGSKVSVDGYYGSAAGIIDEALEVAFGPTPGSEPGAGYWPNYAGLTPHQRGSYLTWLSEGRSAPLDELTFPFLFFYGLERRVLSDLDVRTGHEELISIFHELRKLSSIYGDGSSFGSYTASLCEVIAVVLVAQGIEAPAGWGGVRRWGLSTEVLLGAAVAAKQGLPLPGELALLLVRSHPSARLRTPARRCLTEFDELFLIRYHERHGAGIVTSDPEAGPLTVRHHTGARNVPFRSFVFHRSVLGGHALGEGVPVELEIAEQKQWGTMPEVVLEDLPAALVDDHLPPGLAELLEECQDALAKYSRHLANKGANPDSEKAKSLLPPELQRSRREPVASQVNLEIVADLLAADEVTSLLAERLADTDEMVGRATLDDMGTSAASAGPAPTSDDGTMDVAHWELAQRLAGRALWSKEEASLIAGTLGFPFLGSAVARINEAALDTTGALFVTGDDPIEVDHEIYEEMTVDR